MKARVLAATVFAGALLVGSSAHVAESGQSSLSLTPHLFESGAGQPIAAEWGRLMVPENRTASTGNLIEIPFVRFRAAVPEPGVPLIFLNGGPGEESLGALVDGFLPFVSTLPFDLIIVEQRGIGQARPRLDCPGQYSLDFDRPLDRSHLLAAERAYFGACAAFWRARGVDLAGYNAREMAADIDDLRRALEYDTVNLLGGSFGSHHGLAVLRYHGDTVGRAMLSAVEGPDHTIKLPGTIQHYLEILHERVLADPALSEDLPDFLGTMAAVLDVLEEEPVTVLVTGPDTGEEVAITVGAFDLQLITAAGLGRTEFLQALPRRYHAMSQGDFSWLGEAALDFRTNRGGGLMSILVDCASGASQARRAQIQSEADATLLGDAINGVQFDLCNEVGAGDLGARFRADVESDVPVLLVSGSLDPRTPVSNAEAVQAGLENSQHLIIDGVSHDFDMGPDTLMKYIETQVLFLSGGPLEAQNIAVPFAFTPVAADKR